MHPPTNMSTHSTDMFGPLTDMSVDGPEASVPLMHPAHPIQCTPASFPCPPTSPICAHALMHPAEHACLHILPHAPAPSTASHHSPFAHSHAHLPHWPTQGCVWLHHMSSQHPAHPTTCLACRMCLAAHHTSFLSAHMTYASCSPTHAICRVGCSWAVCCKSASLYPVLLLTGYIGRTFDTVRVLFTEVRVAN